MFEWFNPLFLQDKENNFSTNVFAKTKTIPELYELVSDSHVVTITKLLRKDYYSKVYPFQQNLPIHDLVVARFKHTYAYFILLSIFPRNQEGC